MEYYYYHTHFLVICSGPVAELVMRAFNIYFANRFFCAGGKTASDYSCLMSLQNKPCDKHAMTLQWSIYSNYECFRRCSCGFRRNFKEVKLTVPAYVSIGNERDRIRGRLQPSTSLESGPRDDVYIKVTPYTTSHTIVSPGFLSTGPCLVLQRAWERNGSIWNRGPVVIIHSLPFKRYAFCSKNQPNEPRTVAVDAKVSSCVKCLDLRAMFDLEIASFH